MASPTSIPDIITHGEYLIAFATVAAALLGWGAAEIRLWFKERKKNDVAILELDEQGREQSWRQCLDMIEKQSILIAQQGIKIEHLSRQVEELTVFKQRVEELEKENNDLREQLVICNGECNELKGK